MRLLLALIAILGFALPACAQDGPALLVADQVFVEAGDRLIATGNVEALQGDTRLQASRIVYDKPTDSLRIDGPIRITDPDGNILTADYATLDQSLKNGLLSGARMVLDEQLQIASVEARRVEGRYTQLSRVAVTSCQVCSNRPPLWQIRAERVVHDQQERQLYFDKAQVRVLDVPVFYLPRLRLPDPTLKRAKGFLIPSIRTSTLLGFGVRFPYFVPIGDHQDITLTPYLSSKTRTLDLRYRRAFVNGDLEVNGAVSSDTLQANTARGYLFAVGEFSLPDDFTASFDLKTVSDDGYLSDYDISDNDRLESRLTLSRVRRDDLIQSNLYHFQSLRTTEDNATQPTIVSDFRYEKRWFPTWMAAGEWRLKATTHGHYRYSNLATDGTDTDTEIDGRDVARVNAELSWRNRWTLPMGIRAGASTFLWLDHYETRQDVTSAHSVSSATPGTALELRWPWQRQGAGGSKTLVEPVLQYGWVGGKRAGNPNDESTRVEFDEANLLSLSRFPASDRREHGQTLAAGLRLLHRAPAGWSAALTVGRVWRETADTEFSRSSGLSGTASDWLIAGRFSNASGLSLSARGLLDSQSQFSKAEARAGWSNRRLDLGASYLLLVTDPAEDRTTALSEWSFDGAYRVNRHWTTSTQWRYDVSNDRLDRVGLGLQYRNECVQVDLSASRTYASSTNVEPSTDFDLTVALKGFSTGGSAKEYRRSCSY